MKGRRWMALVLTAALLLPGMMVPALGAASGSASGSASEPVEEEAAQEIPTERYDPTASLTADPVPDSTAGSVLLMDAATGTVLWAENETEQREPASVTKIMTMLLVCEAIDAGQLTPDTMVTTSAHAAGMGGSQVYLEEGEQMTVADLLKAVAVASGNDAAVALGEAVAGSESSFAQRMNDRAQELGMTDTHFVNCTGLPADGHVTTARDIAIMSRELLRHDLIRQYTTIWMDTLRDGAFGLSSTNKLLKTYNGITGLKTGFTSTAGFCMSATAERDGMELIAVVLGAEDSKDRFNTAAALLDYGFANFRTVNRAPEELPESLPVERGVTDSAALLCPELTALIRSADEGNLTTRLILPESLEAPVEAGQQVGLFLAEIDGKVVSSAPVTLAEGVARLRFGDVLERFLRVLTAGTTEQSKIA